MGRRKQMISQVGSVDQEWKQTWDFYPLFISSFNQKQNKKRISMTRVNLCAHRGCKEI